MSPASPAPASSLREAVAAVALSAETDPVLAASLARLADAAGDSLDGVIFFGSRRTGAAKANAWSAYDFFAVVGAYRPFYARLRASGLSTKSPRLLSALSLVLPPTQISLVFPSTGLRAKVSVIRRDVLRRETSARRHDHFTIGRLFQPTRVLEARSEPAREQILESLVSAHAETWRWSRPWQRAPFTAEAFGARALEVSMSWEVRPEPGGRAAQLWAAQRDLQMPVFEALLRELLAAGEVRPAAPKAGEPAYLPTRPAGRLERLRLNGYFTWSLLRATARWLKHVVSFEGWLDYIVRKASRHAGAPIELTPRERRFPLLLLWGRVFRYLRHKDDKETLP